MTARIQAEINSYMYLCLNICRHNAVVMRGVFSLLYDAFVNGARVVSILRNYEDVYFLSLCVFIRLSYWILNFSTFLCCHI